MNFFNNLKCGGIKLDINKFKIKYFFSAFLILMSVFYASFVFLYLDYYPTLNDINGVLSISKLDGNDKWLNGFYGPGYTFISLFIGTEIKSFGILLHFLIVISYMLIGVYLYITKNNNFSAGIILIAILNIVFVANGLNYTDGVPLYLFIIGVILLFIGKSLEKKKYLFFGIFFITITIFFRHHFLIFIPLFFVYYFIFYKGLHKENIYKLSLILFIYFLLLIFNYYLSPTNNWQIFNIYKFFYGVNWHEIDILLKSEQYTNFSISQLLVNEPYKIFITIKQNIFAILKSKFYLIIFIILFLYTFYYSNKKFIIYSFLFALVIAYIFMVLPGWNRGIYPLFLLLFFLSFFSYSKNIKAIVLILLIATLFLQAKEFKVLISNTYKQNRYINHELKSAIDNVVSSSGSIRVFTDDYSLFILDDKYNVDGFRGWLNIKEYYDFSKIRIKFEQSEFQDYDVYLIKKNGYFKKNYKLEGFKLIELKYWDMYFKEHVFENFS